MHERYFEGYLELYDDKHSCAPGFRPGDFRFKIPAYWSARKGDIVLSRNGRGLIAKVLDAIDQKFTHTGIAQGRFAVTHNYANIGALGKATIDYVCDDEGNCDTDTDLTHLAPRFLRYAGPGVRTESVSEATGSDDAWFIRKNSVVLRPTNETNYRQQVQAAANEALNTHSWPQGTPTYNFPGYSNGVFGSKNSICSVFARDANIRAGNDFEVIKEFQFKAKAKQFANLSGFTFKQETIDRYELFIEDFDKNKWAFPYSIEDRKAGGLALYKV